MKADKLLEELTELAKRQGYTVRRETGTFRGGACLVREQRLIIINRTMPLEAAAVILARALSRLDVGDEFLKPAVRAILEREKVYTDLHPDVTFQLVEADTAEETAHEAGDTPAPDTADAA